jgi:hypothetical protein
VVKLDGGLATDLALKAKFVDVRNGDDGTGTPFDGYLQMRTTVRLTDHGCFAPGPCTVIDFPFPIGLPCGSAPTPALPAGKCKLVSGANTIVGPGTVVPGKGMSASLRQFQVYEPGPNVAFEGGVYMP